MRCLMGRWHLARHMRWPAHVLQDSERGWAVVRYELRDNEDMPGAHRCPIRIGGVAGLRGTRAARIHLHCMGRCSMAACSGPGSGHAPSPLPTVPISSVGSPPRVRVPARRCDLVAIRRSAPDVGYPRQTHSVPSLSGTGVRTQQAPIGRSPAGPYDGADQPDVTSTRTALRIPRPAATPAKHDLCSAMDVKSPLRGLRLPSERLEVRAADRPSPRLDS